MATNFSKLPVLPSLKDFMYIFRLRAKKILSQNYLMDMNLARKIVRRAGIRKESVVIEIGPGPGSITRAILESGCSRLDVIEIDHRFIPPLEVLREASESRMHIHHSDILKTDIANILTQGGIKKFSWHENLPSIHVIGNLPFNIASPLIIKFFRDMFHQRDLWSFGRVPLTLTFQLEVAERLCAPLDSPSRARLSIMAMLVSEPKLLFRIPGKCFVPSPKIDVGVVQFLPREEPLIKTSFEIIEKFCRRIFNYRRKHLLKGVKSLYPEELSKELADDMLSKCRVDPTTTCVKLGIEQIADMCYIYESHCKRHPGVFLYEHSNPKKLITLSCLPNAKPPPNPFKESFPSEGVLFSEM